MTRLFVALAAIAVGALLLTSCSPATAGESGDPVTLTVGYFPNLTHAPAIVGLADGQFADAVGTRAAIETATFNSGTEEIEALFAGAIDIGFIGPSPTLTGWSKSKGSALRVIAGTASGGASLVVRDGITTASDLSGKAIATPSLGNTQDVAARYWLSQQGFTTDTSGGGDVSIRPQDNATALTALETGDIDGAWVPEPWATRMVSEAGAHVLVDETDLWQGGDFVTTNVIVRTEFLEKNPEIVRAFLDGLIDTVQTVQTDPASAQKTVAAQIGAVTGSTPDAGELAAAWDHVRFTWDPLPATLIEQAAHAQDLGLLDPVDTDGLYDLGPLNAALAARGLDEVAAP